MPAPCTTCTRPHHWRGFPTAFCAWVMCDCSSMRRDGGCLYDRFSGLRVDGSGNLLEYRIPLTVHAPHAIALPQIKIRLRAVLFRQRNILRVDLHREYAVRIDH